MKTLATSTRPCVNTLALRPLGALGLSRLGGLGGGGAVVGRKALLEELLLKLVEVRACRLVSRVRVRVRVRVRFRV